FLVKKSLQGAGFGLFYKVSDKSLRLQIYLTLNLAQITDGTRIGAGCHSCRSTQRTRDVTLTSHRLPCVTSTRFHLFTARSKLGIADLHIDGTVRDINMNGIAFLY